MFSLSSLRRVSPALALLALLLAPGCTTPPASTPPASTSTPSLQTLDYASSQQPADDLDREIAAAGLDPATLNSIAARLIALLRDPATTPAARQAICQRLNLFPEATLLSGDNRAFFASMLANEQQVNFARLALDLVPGAQVDALYLQALDASTPTTRLALVQSIGNRRVAAAAPSLIALLNSSDVAVRAASIKALGQIGTEEALAALATAPNAFSAPVVEARLTAAHHLGGAGATREFQTVIDSSAAPGHLRAAAFRGLLFAEPAAAPARFVTALSGDDAILKPVVIEAIASHPSKDLVPALTAQLATWDAPTQASVISALASKADAAAVPAVLTALQHQDSAVRAAAITALGKLPGSADVALRLAAIVAGDSSDEAKLARQSLARLNGPGVADAVTAGATSGEHPLRVVFLEQLASRNMAASVPLLLQTREDPDAAIRSAALTALAEIAPPSEQRAILNWAIASTNAAEQSRALRTLASVTLRHPDVAERSRLITDAIEKAEPSLALRLLPVLPRIGGTASAESAAQLALRDDPALSAAAINTLARWTDPAGLLPLVNVAEKTTNDTARTSAMLGAVRHLERTRDLPSSDLTSIVSRLVPLCREAEIKHRLVYLLGRSSSEDALALAKKYQGEPDLATVASDAAQIITANRAGKPSIRGSGNEQQLKAIVDGKTSTRWTVPAKPDQWIEVDYAISRPFRQVVLDNGDTNWGFPETFSVLVSDDASNPGEPILSGAGQPGKTTIDLPPGTRGRYLIIRHTASPEEGVWAIGELIVD